VEDELRSLEILTDQVPLAPLAFNQAITTRPFDGHTAEPSILCEVPRGPDDQPARYVVPERLLCYVRQFDGSKPTSAVVASIVSAADGQVSERELRRLVDWIFLPRGFLRRTIGEVSSWGDQRAAPSGYMQLRIQLIGPTVVRQVAGALDWMFEKWAASTVLAMNLVCHLIVYVWISKASDVNLNQLGGGDVAYVALLTALGAFLHEFGHATAAVRYGCERISIGFGQYLHITVFYTDLSEAWTLKRWERTVVDLGGIYFQLAYQCGLLAAYCMSGVTTFLFAFMLTDIAITGSLNPFFRLDGYWVVADALGVANLRQQSSHALRWMLSCLLPRGWVRARRWSLPPSTAILVASYALMSVAFFLLALKVILLDLVSHTIGAYDNYIIAVYQAVTATPFRAGALVGSIMTLLWRSLILAGLAIPAASLAKRGVKLLATRWKRRMHPIGSEDAFSGDGAPTNASMTPSASEYAP
jgi:putative peptide zinc metalloprotease protein